MEPLAVQTLASLRPLVQPVADLARVLQHGRTVHAEVLQTFDGGTVLLGVGGQRVSAQSQVELRAGEQLEVLVQGEGDELVLRVLRRGSSLPEPELVRLLRAVVGSQRPVGERLAELAQALRSQVAADPAGARGASAARLLGELEGQLVRPGATGPELQGALARAGLTQEAVLGVLARLGDGSLDPARAPLPSPQALGELLLAELGASTLEGSPEEWSALRAALGGALTEGLASLRAGEGFAGLLRALERALAQALRGAPAERLARALAARAAALDPEAFARGPLGGLLARVVGLPTELAPRELARVLLEAHLLDLRADGKSALLAALDAAEEGPVRSALSRALAGLEAEQLLELARRNAHEWRSWSLPFADGDAWRSLRVFHRREGEGRAREEGEPPATHHLVLGLELGALGPVRADLWLGESSLGLRVRVGEARAVGPLRAALEGLAPQLSALRPQVHVAVAGATLAECSVDDLTFDIRYLAEHPLLDLAG